MPSKGPADTRWLRYAGLGAFLVSLFLYRSFENRPVLGLWSYPYTAVLALALTLVLICIWWSSRSARPSDGSGAWLPLFDGALCVWGAAYLTSTLDDRSAASRILDLNVFGSTAPLAALGEWIAIGLAGAGAIAWATPRLGETGRKVLLSVTSVALVIVAAEGFLRIRAAIAPETQGFPTHTNQQWVRRYVELNALGFRDRDHPRDAPAGQRRLLVVGDSYAFGAGVDRVEDRFGEQLAGMLSERLGVPWHSMNAALGNSHTLEELEYLERMEGHERHAVLLVYVFNDMEYLAPKVRSALAEHPGGMLGRLNPVRVLYLNFYLFQEVYVRARMMTYTLRSPPVPTEGPYADPELMKRHLVDLQYFVELASRHDTPVWIVPFDLESREGGLLTARHQRFTAAARSRGLPIITIDRAFDGQESRALTVNRLDRHPNEEAHRLAAARVADELVPILAPPNQE